MIQVNDSFMFLNEIQLTFVVKVLVVSQNASCFPTPTCSFSPDLATSVHPWLTTAGAVLLLLLTHLSEISFLPPEPLNQFLPLNLILQQTLSRQRLISSL